MLYNFSSAALLLLKGYCVIQIFICLNIGYTTVQMGLVTNVHVFNKKSLMKSLKLVSDME